MIKYLDTSTLIKYTLGNNNGHFNWKENIGKELPFQYDDLTGTIKIIDYKSVNRNNLVTVQYHRQDMKKFYLHEFDTYIHNTNI